MSWASRFDGLPGCVSSGLRRGPASLMMFVVDNGPPAWPGIPCFTHCGLRRGPASLTQCVFVMGLPIRRASRSCFIWPPAWTGLRVCSCVADIGPPASSGFPCVQALASGVDRPPGSRCDRSWVSRLNGHPGCVSFGLRHGPASGQVTLHATRAGGFPRDWASLALEPGP